MKQPRKTMTMLEAVTCDRVNRAITKQIQWAHEDRHHVRVNSPEWNAALKQAESLVMLLAALRRAQYGNLASVENELGAER